jgi:hypothetical protein
MGQRCKDKSAGQRCYVSYVIQIGKQPIHVSLDFTKQLLDIYGDEYRFTPNVIKEELPE